MKTKQINNTNKADGNGLQRTCSRSLLAAFIENYKKSNSYPADGNVRVFWIDGSRRVQMRQFMDTYLSDMIKSDSSNTKGSSYKFDVSNPDRFKAYLDAAKSIDLSSVPTCTTNPEGEYYRANNYWQISIPFSKAEQQKVLDGVSVDLKIQQGKTASASAQQQEAEAELAAYQAQQTLQNTKGTKWITVALLALAAIVILKRTKK